MPEVDFNFLVFVDDYFYGDFRKIEGMGWELTPFELKEGGRNSGPHLMIPHDTPPKYKQVTLEKGNAIATTMYDWMDSVKVGKKFRKDIFIYQLGREGLPSRIFHFAQCFPIMWEGPLLDSNSQGELPIERCTFVYERFKMLKTHLHSWMALLDPSSAISRFGSVSSDVSSYVGDVATAVSDTVKAAEELPTEADDALADFLTGGSDIAATASDLWNNDAKLDDDEDDDGTEDDDAWHEDDTVVVGNSDDDTGDGEDDIWHDDGGD